MAQHIDSAKDDNASPLVGLFVTCPVDLFRPSVAEAVVEVLMVLGFDIDVPRQSCCGQIAYNNGDTKDTKKIARQNARLFKKHDYVVVPSGSCGGMLKEHYSELFSEDDPERSEILAFTEKVFEFTAFLHDVVGIEKLEQQCDLSGLTITYHDSCAGLRELGIQAQPRALLKKMANATITEMPNTNVCCGFGGTFCVKYSDISNKMVNDKVRNAVSVDADMLVGGDVSCLLNIAGSISRNSRTCQGQKKIQVRHVAELLVAGFKVPAIGETEK